VSPPCPGGGPIRGFSHSDHSPGRGVTGVSLLLGPHPRGWEPLLLSDESPPRVEPSCLYLGQDFLLHVMFELINVVEDLESGRCSPLDNPIGLSKENGYWPT